MASGQKGTANSKLKRTITQRSIVILVLTIYMAGASLAQPDSSVRFKSNHFEALLEAGMGMGEMYDDLADVPYQLGLRIGTYGFVSKSVALGLGIRASTIAGNRSFYEFYGFGVGPDLLVVGKHHDFHTVVFFKLFAHFVPNFVLIGNESVMGAELGTEFGGMKPLGGFMYGFGVAGDIMNNYPDAFRVFLNFGIGTGYYRKRAAPK